MAQWWKDTVFYEIYISSFCDSNQDGIGDLPGIISKLPYLKELGVGGIWLTPFYPSPKVDNGYDISDYYGIDSNYGTMDDFEKLIQASHELGIKIIVDMVVNHTSTDHPWFLESASSENNSKRDWYIWKDPIEGLEPNNWESFFGGCAWEFDNHTKQYYYHSFAKEQADLNWQNPQVKEAIIEVLNFWLGKGIDGFRFDVINNLSVSAVMEDNPIDHHGKQQHLNDVNQRGVDQVIAAICRRVREIKPDAFLVGEISSDQLEQIYTYTKSTGLDTTFNFNLGSREQFHFQEVINEINDMQALYGIDEYPTVFFGSHDMKRFADRFLFSPGQVKCLLTLMMVVRGIPFLYFGDELGMKNRVLTSIEEANDIQGILAYQVALTQGRSKVEAIQILNEKSRDASRNPMNWEEADRQMNEPDSIWRYLKNLIKIRHSEKEMLSAAIKLTELAHEVIEIKRVVKEGELRTIINFSDLPVTISATSSSQVVLTSEKDFKWVTQHELQITAQSCVMLALEI